MDANRLPPMGWPWDAMADAVLRWDDANRRHHAASVIVGTVDVDKHKVEPHVRAEAVRAMQQAALDRDQAIADRLTIQHDVANQFLLGLRLAIEQEPTALATLLGNLPPSPLLTGAVEDLEDRVDAVEDAVVELKTERVAW